MKKVIILFISICCFITLNAQVKTYTSKDSTFSITYPESWTNIDLKAMPFMSFGILAPRENDSDVFSENINIIIDSLATASYTLKEYRDKNIEVLLPLMQKFKLVSKGLDSTSSKQTFATMVYTHTMGKFNLRVLVYMYMIDKKAYIITSSATEDFYEKYEPIFLKVCRSISFTEN